MFQGIKSPDGLIPRCALFVIDEFDKFPYKANWTAHKMSGIYAFPSSVFLRGPKRTNNKWEGESETSCRSLGLFL